MYDQKSYLSLEHLPHLNFFFSVFEQPEYETELNRKEQEKLKSKVGCLSEEDKNFIYQKGKSHFRTLAVLGSL